MAVCEIAEVSTIVPEGTVLSVLEGPVPKALNTNRWEYVPEGSETISVEGQWYEDFTHTFGWFLRGRTVANGRGFAESGKREYLLLAQGYEQRIRVYLKKRNAIRGNGVHGGFLFGFVGEGEFGFFV